MLTFFGVLQRKVFLFLLILFLATFSIMATELEEEETLPKRVERIAVLDFQTLDEKGNRLDPVLLEEKDLVNLSRIMSMGVASRLVQYGEFQVIDAITLEEELTRLPYQGESTPYEQARVLLAEHFLNQVITGSIVLLQGSAVVTVQRYVLEGYRPRLVGSSMAQAARITEAPALVDTLVQYLFPPDIQVIERTIEQVFVVPSHLRINLGASHQLEPYALDNLGRLVVQPLFLYISSDEAKVYVDEDGVVTALQPGTATITVRGITGTARSGPPATMTVVNVPPAIGIRIGGMITDIDEVDGFPIRFGLRFTPSFDSGSKKVEAKTDFGDATNPLAIISSFFSSLLTSGMMTFDLDFDPNKEMLFVLSGVQRTSTGYLGTGFGYVTPLGEEIQQGFTLRFTAGTQLHLASRVSYPVEAVMDMIFPADTSSRPVLRIGVNIGFDLFP